MMKMTKDEAAKWASNSPKWKDKSPVISVFNDPQALKEWGWTPIMMNGTDLGSGDIKSELVDFITKLDLYPTTSTAWANHRWGHTKDWNMNGKTGKVS